MPPADVAVRIARALGVTVEYLVTGKGQTTPQDIRAISRDLLKLNQRSRKVVAILIKAMLEQEKNSWTAGFKKALPGSPRRGSVFR
jgi:hypothetical protein